jgi:ABC-type glycerol-3-phosphate transport system substrate-binding protein
MIRPKPVGAALLALAAFTMAAGCAGGGGPSSPVIAVTPSTLDFPTATSTADLTIANTQTGSGTLEWTVTTPDAAPWLSASPASGEGAGTVTVTVDRTGLSNGQQTSTVTISSNGGDDVTVGVTMTVPPGDANVVVQSTEEGDPR